MGTRAMSGVLAAALAVCVGCEKDFYAKQILVHNTGPGKIAMDVTGSGQRLIRQKRIDLNPRMEMADGTEIDVWVLRAKPGPEGVNLGTALLLHGLGESKARYLPAGENLSKKGFDVVLVDLRCHGRSGGEYVTYGAWEKQDVKAVMDRLIADGTVQGEIYVFGATLGATTAIQYAASDRRVKGVIALTPYKDAASTGRRVLFATAPTMSHDEYERVLAQAGEMADFDPHATSSVAAARSVLCPLLLVHGLLDLSVPLESSQAIYEAAAGPKKLIVVTPGPEQLVLATQIEFGGWIPERIRELATVGLRSN